MLQLDSVTIKADRLVAVVCVVEGSPTYTDADIMARVIERFPDLPNHPCVNARGPRFADVMDRTSLPHLLEHIVIDLQAEAYTQACRGQKTPDGSTHHGSTHHGRSADMPQGQKMSDESARSEGCASAVAPIEAALGQQPPLLMGTTKWIARSEGLAQVQVSFFDDLVALKSLREALDFLNSVSTGQVRLK